MHDDIPDESDTEFQHEIHRKTLAYRHEIALVRIRNKHELRTLRVGHAHKAEIARTVGSELRETLSLYSDGILKFCAFLGPDSAAALASHITDRAALAAERIAGAYFAGPCRAETCHAKPSAHDERDCDDCDGCDGCAPETDGERRECEEFQQDLASGGWGDEGPEDSDDDKDGDGDENSQQANSGMNIFELRSGTLSHPVLGILTGVDDLIATLPDVNLHVEARSLPVSLDEDSLLRWLDPVAREDLETWRPLAEYAIRGGHLVSRDGVTTVDAELARFQDCLLRVSTRPSSAPRDVAVSPTGNDAPVPASENASPDANEDDLGNDQASAVEDLQALCAEPAPASTSDEVREGRLTGHDRSVMPRV